MKASGVSLVTRFNPGHPKSDYSDEGTTQDCTLLSGKIHEAATLKDAKVRKTVFDDLPAVFAIKDQYIDQSFSRTE